MYLDWKERSKLSYEDIMKSKKKKNPMSNKYIWQYLYKYQQSLYKLTTFRNFSVEQFLHLIDKILEINSRSEDTDLRMRSILTSVPSVTSKAYVVEPIR